MPRHRLPPRRQRRAVLPHLRTQLEVRIQLCPNRNTEALSFQHFDTTQPCAAFRRLSSAGANKCQGRTSRSEVGLALSARFLLALSKECNPDPSSNDRAGYSTAAWRMAIFLAAMAALPLRLLRRLDSTRNSSWKAAQAFNYPYFPRFFSISSRFPRDFWPCSLDSWRPDAENGRKMGENG